MKRLFQNKFMLLSIVGGFIVIVAIAAFVMSAGATTKAAVLNTDAKAGTTITESMVQEIDVAENTPGDFFKSSSTLIGERLTSNVSANQLIYPGDLMSSIELVGSEQNPDYVVTSISVPDDQAIGGLLTAGDRVDISVIPNDSTNMAKLLPEFNINPTINGGIYYILANVVILDATTSVASEQGSNLASTVEGSTNEGSTYLVSLSYNDFKKLRIADQYGKVYLNLSPDQNESNPPLLNDMSKDIQGGLSDATPLAKQTDSTTPEATTEEENN